VGGEAGLVASACAARLPDWAAAADDWAWVAESCADCWAAPSAVAAATDWSLAVAGAGERVARKVTAASTATAASPSTHQPAPLERLSVVTAVVDPVTGS